MGDSFEEGMERKEMMITAAIENDFTSDRLTEFRRGQRSGFARALTMYRHQRKAGLI